MAKPDWITLSKDSGTNTEEIDVSVSNYNGRLDRSGVLNIFTTLGSPTVYTDLQLSQNSPGLLLIPYIQTLEVEWGGGEFSDVMEWATNSPSIIGGTPTPGSSWEFFYNGLRYSIRDGIVFQGDPGANSLVSGKFKVVIPSSNLLASRDFSLIVSTSTGDNDISKTFIVTQSGRPAYISCEPESLLLESYQQHSVQFNILCNDDLNWIQINTLPDWITLSKDSGIGNYVNTITFKNNDYLTVRSSTLVFKQIGGELIERDFVVKQAGSPLIFSLSPQNQVLEYNDLSEKSVSITTNPDNEWSVLSKPDWIDIVSEQSFTGNGIIKYNANEQNNERFQREGRIIFNNSTGDDKEFIIIQKELPASINLNPTNINAQPSGGSFSVNVDCTPGLSWSASLNKGTLYDVSISPVSGVGPGVINVTIGNNKSESSGTGSITVTQLTSSATATINQSEGAKVYSDITISSYSYGKAGAAGGSITPSISYSQTWTWNGVAGSGGTINSGAQLSFTGGGINTSSGVATVPSKGINISNETTYTTGLMTVKLNGKTATKYATVNQLGNYVTGIYVTSPDFRYDKISAGATTATPIIIVGTNVREFTFSSGAITNDFSVIEHGSYAAFITYSLSESINGFTSVNKGTGVLTATNRGTVIGEERTSGVITRTISATWYPDPGFDSEGIKSSTNSKTSTCTQALNKVTKLNITSSIATSYPSGDIPASGGTKTPDKIATLSYTYSSGSVQSTGLTGYSATRTYSMPTTSGFSLNTSNGVVTASSRGTTVGERRSATITCEATFSYTNPSTVGGDTVSNSKTDTLTVYQAANIITYGTPSGGSISVGIIPASGGTVNSGTPSGTVTQSRSFSSGFSDSISSAIPTNGTWSTVTAPSLGNTVKPRTFIGYINYTYTLNGKQGTVQDAVDQAENTITKLSIKKDGGGGTPVTSVPASQSSYGYVLTFTCSSGEGGGGGLIPQSIIKWSFNKTWGSWTNQSSSVTYYGSMTYFSRGTEAGSARSGVLSCTVNGSVNGVSINKTGSLSITQAANVATVSSTGFDIFSYPSISYNGGTYNPTIDVIYDLAYSSGSFLYDQHGLPSGYYLRYSVTGTGFSINSTTGALTVTKNTSSNSRTAKVMVEIKNSSGTTVNSKILNVTQPAYVKPTISITTSFNYGSSKINVIFSQTPLDNLSLHFMGYSADGAVWSEYCNIQSGSPTSFEWAPSRYIPTDDYSLDGVNGESIPPYETSNAKYTW